MDEMNIMLKNFNISSKQGTFTSVKYSDYSVYINSCISGEGEVGKNSYLILWNRDEIEELNNAYEVEEFMTGCILIGSDGGDTAYGIDKCGNYFSVPFIGMDDDEKVILGEGFAEFISKLYDL